MIRTGDQVSKTAAPYVSAKVVNTMCRPTIIIQYPDGTREKVLESELMLYKGSITPEKFDEAVRAIMRETAESGGDSELIDDALEIIGSLYERLKKRLFGGND